MMDEALRRLKPGIAFTMVDDDYSSIKVFSKHALPSEDELKALYSDIEAEFAIKDTIEKLEREITPRRIREAILGTDGDWLKTQEGKIATERAKP